jgi:uncharacterized protein DUF1688
MLVPARRGVFANLERSTITLVRKASPGEPLRVDAAALTGIDAATLGYWFQAGERNPLVGLEGRAALLRRLGDVLETRPDRFGLIARPSALFEHALDARTIAAPAILGALLDAFSDIWRAHGARASRSPIATRLPASPNTATAACCSTRAYCAC